MSKHRILVLTGLWIMILPFLGFPRGFKNTLFIITGLILILLAYTIKRRKRIQRLRKSEERKETYQDNPEDGTEENTEDSNNIENE